MQEARQLPCASKSLNRYPQIPLPPNYHVEGVHPVECSEKILVSIYLSRRLPSYTKFTSLNQKHYSVTIGLIKKYYMLLAHDVP